MKNKVQLDGTINVTLAAAITAGSGLLIGATIFGVAVTSGAIGDVVAFSTRDVWSLPCTSGDDIAQGDALYWDNTAKELTKTATGNLFCAKAWSAAGVGVTSVNAAIFNGGKEAVG